MTVFENMEQATARLIQLIEESTNLQVRELIKMKKAENGRLRFLCLFQDETITIAELEHHGNNHMSFHYKTLLRGAEFEKMEGAGLDGAGPWGR